MPFDLATARPAGQPSGGFDLSTARPAPPRLTRDPAVTARSMAEDPERYDPNYRVKKPSIWRAIGGAAAAIPEAAASAAQGAVATAVGGASGVGAAALNPYLRLAGVNTAAPADVIERVQSALSYQPVTESGQRLAGQISAPFEKLAEGADVVGGGVARLTGSPAAGAAVNTAIQSLPAIFMRGRVGNGRSVPAPIRSAPAMGEVSAVRPNAAARAVPAGEVQAKAGRPAGLERAAEKAPTNQQLKDASQAAYQRATDAGVVVNETGTQSLKQSIQKAIAEDYDSDLHPHVRAILKRVEATEGKLTLDQIEKLRRFASKQEGSAFRTPGADDSARIAGEIVDTIDDFTDGPMGKFTAAGDAATGVQALNDARNLYTRNRKSQQLDDMVESARESAGQFSVSGLENGIRTEFRKLAKNKKRMARWSADEQAAIRVIARGDRPVNAMRFLGKLAPTGQMSQIAWIASTIATGGTAAMLPALGTASRYAAGRMQLGKVNRLSEMTRRGGPNAAPLSRNKRPEMQEVE